MIQVNFRKNFYCEFSIVGGGGGGGCIENFPILFVIQC